MLFNVRYPYLRNNGQFSKFCLVRMSKNIKKANSFKVK